MSNLSENFYRVPHLAEQTVTTKELKDIMLETGGEIMACGRLWKLKKENLGAGVYKLTAKVKNV